MAVFHRMARGGLRAVNRCRPAGVPRAGWGAGECSKSIDTKARAYEAAERLHTVSSYRLVIERYPDTLYAGLAKQQMEKLKVITTPSVAPSPASLEEALGLTRTQRVMVQRGLKALGFDVGAADGIFGVRTRAGIGEWRSSRGEPPTRYLDAEALETLVKAGEAAPSQKPKRIVVQEALDTLSDALSTARTIESPMARVPVLASIATAQAKAGEGRAPGALIGEMTAVVCPPRSEPRRGAIRETKQEICHARHSTEAVRCGSGGARRCAPLRAARAHMLALGRPFKAMKGMAVNMERYDGGIGHVA